MERFPFRVHTIQTDNGHDFQAKFHWHCEDLGVRHIYFKPASPHLNAKVECSHPTDQTKFYQLIEYKCDIDFAKKLFEWEIFYNCHRPNAPLKGKTPYEVLKLKLSLNNNSFSNTPPSFFDWGFEKELYVCTVSLSLKNHKLCNSSLLTSSFFALNNYLFSSDLKI